LDPNCTTACTLMFSGNPFILNDRIDYTIGVCISGTEICLPDSEINDLAGGRYSYKFSDGYVTTSLLELVNGELTASSRKPDLATFTSLDLSQFTPFSAGLPCAMAAGETSCPPLVLPGDDTIENLICLATPEPPTTTIILIAILLTLGHRRRWRSRRLGLFRVGAA